MFSRVKWQNSCIKIDLNSKIIPEINFVKDRDAETSVHNKNILTMVPK